MSSTRRTGGPLVGRQDTPRERRSSRYWDDLQECRIIGHEDDPWNIEMSADALFVTHERHLSSDVDRYQTANPPYVNRIFGLVEQLKDNPQAVQDISNEFERSALLAFGEAYVNTYRKQQTDSLRTEFEALADAWRKETAGYSLAAQYAAHPAYRRIIGMGRPVLPLIFEKMTTQGGRWYVALHAITNANPVPPEDRGHRVKTREAWLDWAREQKIISS